MAKIKKLRTKKPDVALKQAAASRHLSEQRSILPTANAKVIFDLMASTKVKGHYKDYVIIAGKRLMDWRGSFDLIADDGKTIGINGMALLHKSKLEKVIGPEMARNFWHAGIGRVGMVRSKKHA
jgi:hypothetical protein